MRGVLLALGLAATAGAGCGQKQAVQYQTAPIERGRIEAKVTATGTLSALVTVQVGAQVSGRIQDLFVDFNSPVKKGMVLARIDPSLFQATVEQARANLVAAQGNLARSHAEATQAERTLHRTRELSARNLVARADLDMSEAQAAGALATVQASQGAVAQARASLHQAETNLAYTTIGSPIDGVVISRSVDVGQTVASALQAPTLFTIAQDLRQMQVDTNVAEADVGKLQAGMAAVFTVDAYPGERFHGTVRQIRNSPQTVQNVVTYDAVIDVPNPDQKLRPGMTANVIFVYAVRDDVVRVPNTALRFRPDASLLPDAGRASDGGTSRARGGSDGRRGAGGSGPHEGRTVWVLRDQKPEPVVIQVGVSDGTFSEVTGGQLEGGQEVIIDAKGPTTRPASGGPAGGGSMRRMF